MSDDFHILHNRAVTFSHRKYGSISSIPSWVVESSAMWSSFQGISAVSGACRESVTFCTVCLLCEWVGAWPWAQISENREAISTPLEHVPNQVFQMYVQQRWNLTMNRHFVVLTKNTLYRALKLASRRRHALFFICEGSGERTKCCDFPVLHSSHYVRSFVCGKLTDISRSEWRWSVVFIVTNRYRLAWLIHLKS